jgi:hypothetical protein
VRLLKLGFHFHDQLLDLFDRDSRMSAIMMRASSAASLAWSIGTSTEAALLLVKIYKLLTAPALKDANVIACPRIKKRIYKRG